MESVEVTLSLALFVSLLPLTGILLAITPFLMKKRECFAVTIPETAQDDGRLQTFKYRYAAIVFLVTVLGTILVCYCLAIRSQEALLASFMSAIFALIGVSFVLMLYFRKRVQEIKKQEQWVAQEQTRSAVMLEADAPKPLSLTWNILYIPIMVLTLLIGVVGYPAMPDMVPVHANMLGEVDQWAPKSWGVIVMPVVVQFFLAIILTICHGIIIHSKRAVDPEAPISSALAYALFARAQSVLTVVAGLACTAIIGALIQLTSLGSITMSQAAVVLCAVVIPIVVAWFVLALLYGQSGARAIKRIQAADTLLMDDDAFWKLGVFYFNKEDASLFVPERFGIGWTCNLARPAVWILFVGILILTIVFIVMIFALL